MPGCGGAGAGGAGEGFDPRWDEALRLVGDPVDVVTGAEAHLETDFRLPGAAVPMKWVRYYDSRRATVDREMGFGFRFMFDVELRLDIDGMTFVDGKGVEIAFPFPNRDGESITRNGHVLERLSPQRYRVQRPGNVPCFELEMGRDLTETAQLTAMIGERGKGRAIRFSYDARGLAAIEVGAPGRLVIERDGAHIAGVVLLAPTGQRQRLVRYGYDARGFLVEVENAYGHVRRYGYDAAGRMSRQVDRRGFSFLFSYDGQGRCVHSRGEDGVVEYRFEYKPHERLTVVTRADGAVWRYFYDDQGSIVQTVDPYGGLTAFVKDASGRVVKEIDPNGNESDILYDEFGAIHAKRDSFGHVRRLPNDPSIHPLYHFHPPTPADWDHGWLFGSVGTGRARPVEERLPPWVKAVVAAPTEASMQPPRVEEDVQGRSLRDLAVDGRTRNWEYDPNGYQSWSSDFGGQITRYEYRSWNHLVRVEQPLKRVVEMSYTIGEQIASVADAGGARSEYKYDLKDRLIEVRRNGRVREQYSYDAADNLVEKRDGDGKPILKLVIGKGNVVKQRVLAASGDAWEYTRDDEGYVVEAKNGAGACAFEYARGRRTLDERDGLGVRHEYDGWHTRRTTVLGRFTTQYMTPERGLTLVLDPGDQIQRLRGVDLTLMERACSNGVGELSHYDGQGRCLLKAAEGPTLGGGWARRFLYSGDGDLLRREDSLRGATNYRHDPARRLATVENPDGSADRYVYDIADNLLEAPGLIAGIQPGNRLVVANRDRFEYDTRDHVARRWGADGETRYSYSSRDQLVAVDGPGLSYRAEHDAFGRRTKKTVNGQTWTFHWDTDRLAAEVFPDGRLRVYVYADAEALVPILFLDYAGVDADPAGGKRYHVYTDHLGCPELVLDDQARTVWRARILPYGTAIVEVGADFHQPLRWPCHYHDVETGLHENRFRSYSPELCRYLQSDPDGVAGGINLYAYTDNPLRGVDLDGLGKVCPDDKKNCKKKKEDGDDDEHVKPGEVGSYKELKDKAKVGDKLEHDHIPAYASVRDAINAQRKKEGKKPLTTAQENKLKDNLSTMEVPREMHKEGRTHSGKGGDERQAADAKNLKKAAEDDLAVHRENTEKHGIDKDSFDSSAQALHDRNEAIGLYDKTLPDSLWQ